MQSSRRPPRAPVTGLAPAAALALLAACSDAALGPALPEVDHGARATVGASATTQAPTLTLVSARDSILGAFPNQRSVYADATHIYLGGHRPVAGSWAGVIFVLARDVASDLPIVQTVNLPYAVTGVHGDNTRLQVSSSDGKLRVYTKGPPLTRTKTRTLTTYGLR